MANNSDNIWRLFWTLIHEWFCATFIHLYIIHTIILFRTTQSRNRQGKSQYDRNCNRTKKNNTRHQ